MKTVIDSKCCTEACPAIPIMMKNLEAMQITLDRELSGMHKVFKEWTEESMKSRQETLHFVEGIYNRLNEFLNIVMAKLIAVVESLAQGSITNLKERGDSHESRK